MAATAARPAVWIRLGWRGLLAVCSRIKDDLLAGGRTVILPGSAVPRGPFLLVVSETERLGLQGRWRLQKRRQVLAAPILWHRR